MNTATTLPPTPRDFDIHRSSLIQHLSTRTLAEKHGISQTRVRQVIQRVCDWLAESLPVKTEAQQEQQTRLAQHLAADQLRHQIEQLQILFDNTHDPKYLRQQNRAILSLARLGTIPGCIDSLAADATEGPYDPTEPQSLWSEDDPWANSKVVRSGPERTEAENAFHCPTTTTTDLSPTPLSPSTPPPGDCSRSNGNEQPKTASPNGQPAPIPCPTNSSEPSPNAIQADIEGLNAFERRLLTLDATGRFKEPDEIENFRRNLSGIRRQRATLELSLAPHIPGAKLTDPASTTHHSPTHQLPYSA